MIGVAELLIPGLWKLFPANLRFALTRLILRLQTRALRKVPSSDVDVYIFSQGAKKYFPEAILGEKRTAEAYPASSLVSTCRNEGAQIESFLDAILYQSVHPQEVIICDGGSDDDTLDRAQSWYERASSKGALPFVFKLIAAEPISIAAGRNRAAENASHPILLLTDAGATIDKNWVARILEPFVAKPETEVSMGWYKSRAKNAFSKAMSSYLMPALRNIVPATFLPSGRSLALRREVFWSVGGYPEHLSFAGEDSLFDFYLKPIAKHWAFVPEALAFWECPSTTSSWSKTLTAYAKGDAEGGVLFWDYYLKLVTFAMKLGVDLIAAALLLFLGIVIPWKFLVYISVLCGLLAMLRLAVFLRGYSPQTRGVPLLTSLSALVVMLGCQLIGFIRGLRTFSEVEERRISAGVAGHVVCFTPRAFKGGVDDENSEIVRALIDGMWYITIISEESPYTEEGDLHFIHPRLEVYQRSQFDPLEWTGKHEMFLLNHERKIRFLDFSQDSFSRELVNRLRVVGADRMQPFEAE
jgi:glycosyltransferase involved in cell wall biosynthesis